MEQETESGRKDPAKYQNTSQPIPLIHASFYFNIDVWKTKGDKYMLTLNLGLFNQMHHILFSIYLNSENLMKVVAK